jgi:glycine/D-amino acid oxidase-like deaminating enzyme
MPRTIIVGAGIFGASLARHLARDGWQVTLVDKDRPGHELGASGDASRLIRSAHGSDRWYARSARRARELWRELEEESRTPIFEEVGLSWLAQSADGWEADSEQTLREEGIPVEHLDADAGREFFPSFDPEGLDFILFEPEAGVLRARDGLLAVVDHAVAAGTQLVLGEARPAGEAVEIDGERRSADVVVWACGAWLASLFPELVDIRVTRQNIFYFDGGEEWSTPPVPGWVEYDAAYYGLGDLNGRGVKIAPDSEGPPFDPDDADRAASAESEAMARSFAAGRFPGLEQAPLTWSRICPYALTVDTNFVIARHPEWESHWILGGGSGHGFKHGPALAEYVASVLEGEPDSRFGLGPRQPGGSLRTAGT